MEKRKVCCFQGQKWIVIMLFFSIFIFISVWTKHVAQFSIQRQLQWWVSVKKTSKCPDLNVDQRISLLSFSCHSASLYCPPHLRSLRSISSPFPVLPFSPLLLFLLLSSSSVFSLLTHSSFSSPFLFSSFPSSSSSFYLTSCSLLQVNLSKDV